MAVFRISPSMLNSFVQGYVNDAINAFYGHYPEATEYMKKGTELHEKLGYNNRKKFSVTFELDGDYVELVGIPDKIDRRRVYECKILNKYNGWINPKKKNGAEIQVLAYLFMLGYHYGEVHFFDAKTERLVFHLPVTRDDKRLMNVIRKFIRTIKKQQHIDKYITIRGDMDGND